MLNLVRSLLRDRQTRRMQQSAAPPTVESIWQLLLRWRWWLGGVIGLAFAVGRAGEALFLRSVAGSSHLLVDVLLWGGLGGFAVWFSLTWASRQERYHQTELERLLLLQQDLNQQLQRSHAQLSLLSEVNQSLATSASLDEILDVALRLPQRLLPSAAVALWLHDASEAVLARTANATAEQVQERRAPFLSRFSNALLPQSVTAPGDPDGLSGVCVRLPLHDGAVVVGWVELYTRGKHVLQTDEWALLHTIAGEIGEAITGARRRSREERAIYELEQAIAEERARIARDIHDGLAQTLAFRRMRVDLWLDWLDQDPERLRTELRALKPMLREQIAELRRAIFALRPLQFDELGFVGGLHRYITEFGEQQGWSTEIDLSGLSAFLSPQLEATTFRLLQEALTNAAKHANATRVTVRYTQVDAGLQLVICDNGRGFHPGAASGEGSQLGLRQMRERLNALHGRLTILSQPGGGTELRVWLPTDTRQNKR